MKKPNTRETAGATGVVVALEPTSKNPSNCRMARDADADQKDQQNDRSRAACDRAARIRRGKSRRKGSPVLRADRPSSPNLPAATDRENHSEALVANTF